MLGWGFKIGPDCVILLILASVILEGMELGEVFKKVEIFVSCKFINM